MSTGPTRALLHHLRRAAAAPEDVLPTDRELLRRFARERDQDAFAALVRRHGPLVLAVCRRLLGNAVDAEDAFQATFLVLARKAAAVRWQDSVANWLHGVAHRLARRARADAARRLAREQHAPTKAPTDPLAEVSLREAQALLDEELARLPEKYRAPLVLCCLQGLARDEAARQLGWPVALLKSRLEQARDLLRSRLARRGLTLSAALWAALLAEPAAAVPATLADAVVQAAALAGTTTATPVPVSAAAVALAEQALRGRPLTWLKVLAAVLALGALGLGAAVLSQPAPRPAQPAAVGADPGKPKPPQPKPPPAKAGPLKIEIALPKAEVPLGAPVPLTVTYTNTSAKPLVLLASGTRSGDGFDGETYQVSRAGAKREYTTFGTDPRVVQKRLEPGKSWQRTIKDLSAELTSGGVAVDGQSGVVPPPPFPAPGQYVLRLRYDSTVRNQKPPTFSGSVSSNAVKLTIRQAPPAPPAKRVEDLARDLDRFQLVIFPPRATHLAPRIYLSVPRLMLPPLREARAFHIERAKAKAILDRLARLGFFDRAHHIAPDQKSADDEWFRGVGVASDKLGWFLEGRWGAGTERLLKAVRQELDGDAARELDRLLKAFRDPMAFWGVRTKDALAALRGKLDQFRLELTYWGAPEGRPPSLVLHVAARDEPPAAGRQYVRIDRNQAERLVEHLALRGFFELAKDVEGKSIAYSGPAYVLSAQAPGVLRRHDEILGWGPGLLARLEGLREPLDGEAGKALDALRARVKQVQQKARPPAER
jgi:RNA polymerase sigma factor (sigma-70 family)